MWGRAGLLVVAATVVALCGAPGGAADDGVVTVTWSSDHVVLVLPTASVCLTAHLTQGGAPLANAHVYADQPTRGLQLVGVAPDQADTDASGNVQLCFGPPNPQFPIAGDFTVSVEIVSSPTSGVLPVAVNSTVVTIAFPAPSPAPPPPPAMPWYALSASSHVSASSVTIGDAITFNSTVINSGSSTATGLTVDLEGTTLAGTQPSVEVASLTATSGTCDLQTMRCTIGALAPGGAVTMTMAGRVVTAEIPIVLTAYAQAGEPSAYTYTNASSSSTVAVTPLTVDGGISFGTSSASNVRRTPLVTKVRRTVQIPITVRNDGPGTWFGAYATVKLPSGLQLVSCGEPGCIYAISFGDLAPGASATAVILVKPTLARSFAITASIIPNNNFTDPSQADNTATMLLKATAAKKARTGR